jgi:signal peptidase II
MKQPLSDSLRPGLIAIRVGLPVVIVVLIADQFTKYAVMHWLNLQSRGVLEVLPFLDFSWVTNYGTAMGVIAMSKDSSRWILIAFTSIVSLVVLYLLLGARRWSDGAALGLILGGAIGNLIDRLRYGYVVDFIHFHSGSLGFYVFNVADASITIGAVWIAINYQRLSRSQTKSRGTH